MYSKALEINLKWLIILGCEKAMDVKVTNHKSTSKTSQSVLDYDVLQAYTACTEPPVRADNVRSVR